MLKERKGFTLIELMIVVAIIGILAAIAIPQYSAFRIKAYNSQAQSQLRGLATAMEAYYATYDGYTNTKTLPSYTDKTGITVTAPTLIGTTGWSATAVHIKGDKTYTWDSTANGLQP
jgi:prepilin-type N-terminal cleavage/methylation domain